MFYAVLGAILFSCATTDIREITESMAPGFTAFVMFIKYAIFTIRAEEVFKIVDEIEELNRQCKKPFGLKKI